MKDIVPHNTGQNGKVLQCRYPHALRLISHSGQPQVIFLTAMGMSSILPFLSIKFTKVELYSEIIDFSSDSPSAAAIKIKITLPRISVSGNSRPRSRNGISYRMALIIRTKFQSQWL